MNKLLNRKEKETIVKWLRETYGIPDNTGFRPFFPSTPSELMHIHKELFPHDWDKFNRRKTLRQYPTYPEFYYTCKECGVRSIRNIKRSRGKK